MRQVHLYLVAVYLVLIAAGTFGIVAAWRLLPGLELSDHQAGVLGLVGLFVLSAGLVFLADLLWRLYGAPLRRAFERFGDWLTEYDEQPHLVVRSIRPAPPEPEPEPGPLDHALDRINDAVTELVLNCRPAAVPEGTFPSPDDDTPLAPLDRGRFLTALQDRFAAAVVQIADVVERARTVRELAQYNAQVGAVLGALHDEVLREVVRQQPAEPSTVPVPAVVSSRPAEPAPRRRRKAEQAVEFPGAWARKYRGMRANER